MMKNILKRISALVAMAMAWLTVCALPTRFYDSEHLSSNMIEAICQDSQGYVWVGTEYGLNKYDGVYFKQYFNDEDNPQSLLDNIIRHLYVDRDGHVWVVSNLGVQRYERQTDNFRTVEFAVSQAIYVCDIMQTPDGKLLVLSSKNGVYEVDTEKLTATPLDKVNKHIRKNKECDNMYADSRGRLWIAYAYDGLQMIDMKNGNARYYPKSSFGNMPPADIIEDGRQRITIDTYSTIYQLDERKDRFVAAANYPRCMVRRMYPCKDNRILLGTTGNGMLSINLNDATVAPVMEGNGFLNTESARVHAYLMDKQGNEWIGCNQRGLLLVLHKSEPFHFMPLDKMESNNGNPLRMVFADREGNMYVGQEKGGIVRMGYDGRMQQHWLGNHTMLTLYQAHDGTFWAGGFHKGLFHIDPRTGKEERMPQMMTKRIGGITQDRNGNLYVAVFNEGLFCYTPDGRTERTLCKGNVQLHNRYLNTLFTDRSGLIWIGHYYGIDVYDPQHDRLADISVPERLRPAIVYSIVQSPKDQSIWIGSDKGMFRYYTQGAKKGQWTRYTMKDGLPNDIVCKIVIGKDGTVWASTYRGMCRMDTEGRFTQFYRGNGLQEWTYLRGVGALSKDGNIIFGHQNGITYFSPDEITRDTFRQGITLTNMRMGDSDVNTSTLSNGGQVIAKALDETDDITVSYIDNTFSLRFSSMDFRDPQNVHYEFRFDSEAKGTWHRMEAGRSEIYFSRLAVGKYRLHVRAYDNGVYSEEKIIMIHVTPPWYSSPLAYILYIAVIICIAVLFWHNRWNKRQAEINEEKIRFFVDISHELRSPLTLIKNPLDKLLSNSRDPQVIQALRNMERNTQRMLTLVNQILSIRKIEKGQMTFHYAETDIVDFVRDICHDYDYHVEKRQINMTFADETQAKNVWIDRDNFDKVVANVVGNAIKYVQDEGRIDVVLRNVDGSYMEMVVRDNGPGIDETQLKKVFERFYQASARPAAGLMSYGIGLNLAQKIVVLHGGTITARNRTDAQGSEFVVRLPLGNAHLPQDQIVDANYFAVAVNTKESALPVTDADRPRRIRKKTTYHLAIVDDDEEILTFLRTELSPSYHVRTYNNGQEALRDIMELTPDIVVSDVVMPGMNGFELLQRLKSSTVTSHIPVVLLTTKTEHQSRIEGLEHGADAYIDKPFNMEELETLIANLIANRLRLRGKFSGAQEQSDTVRNIELKGNDAQLMERIMKAVNERLDDSDFNVEALADAVGLSRVQLHRRMKDLTGITVGEFIRNLRLQQAAKLLSKGDITVAQVTYAVGFSSPNHFATTFKKHFGISPSEYMEKHSQTTQEEGEG